MTSAEDIKKALAVLAQAEAEGLDGAGLINVAVINKTIPKGWKLSTNAPYYNEKSALVVKQHIDKILADHAVVITITPRFVKVQTQYHKLCQGQLYLIDHLDPEGIYAAAKHNIEVSRNLENVVIHWKENPGMVDVDITDNVTLETKEKRWKADLEDFLATSHNGDRFLREKIVVTAEDEAEIRRSVMNLNNFHIKRLGRTVLEIVNMEL